MPMKLRRSFLVLLIASVAIVPDVVTALDLGADPLSPEHLTLWPFPSAQLAPAFYPSLSRSPTLQIHSILSCFAGIPLPCSKFEPDRVPSLEP